MSIDTVDISDHVVEKFLNNRVRLAVILMLVACGFIVARLYYLQILKGSKYTELSINNRIRVTTIPAPRGIIFSKQNVLLVSNNPSFDLNLIPQDTPDPNAVVEKIAVLLQLNSQQLKKKIAGQRGRPPFEPITLKKELPWEEMSLVLANKMKLPGISIDVLPKRLYCGANFAPHVFGFLGEIDRTEMAKYPPGVYRQGDLIGKFGLEKWGEQYLRGEKGGLQTEVDAHGNRQKILAEIEPTGGCNIIVTLDAKLQKAAEEQLRDKVGAVVAMRPTGEVLALASSPGFDASLFARGIDYDEWSKLTTNPLHPLLNRAIQTAQPPGSVFKIITAIAALEEKVIDPSEQVFCPGYYSLGNTTFRCWKKGGHGSVSMHDAIVRSCDTYFYTVGQRLGVDRLHKYATLFGLGEKTGIELDGEKSGLIPSEAWKKKKLGVPWQKGETCSIAIGQGYVQTTPLQIATFFCAVANGTYLPRPRLVEQVRCDNDTTTTPIVSEKIRDLKVSPKTMAFIREALMGVVHDPTGTATKVKIEGLTIGGKTGTAQVVSRRLASGGEDSPWKYRDHAWFVCMAPVEKPEIIVAVFLEHGGHGGSAAGPIAREIVAAHLMPSALKTPPPVPASQNTEPDTENEED
jgi:penicillin-binding protein 2